MTKTGKLSLFLENSQNVMKHEAAYIYDAPVDIISISNPNEIENAFLKIKDKLNAGFHVAGWISYEAGLWLEEKLKPLMPKVLEYPLIHMGVYKSRNILSSQDADHYWQNFKCGNAYSMSELGLSQTRDEYKNAIEAIEEYLNSGDIYQVNYTLKARFDFEGDRKALYADLRHAQQVEYGAYIESDELTVLSLSPELFVKKNEGRLVAKPMKGTTKRGRTVLEDKVFSENLIKSDKERAENLMIVDLLRNDLSKISTKGSVDVAKLYEVEKYRSLFTMTSTINANVETGFSAVEVMTAIFPCGSVTGAPKIRAQQIINELESHQRGIYTGAIGYFTPEGNMCFSVPIRTLTINNAGKGELGIGGAIVADSVWEKEYDECLLKAAFVAKEYPAFDLIETFGFCKVKGMPNLKYHLNRMEASAEYFSFLFNRNEVEQTISDHVQYITGDGHFKVRVLLSRTGNVSILAEKLIKRNHNTYLSITLCNKQVDSQNALYFHKTTYRDFYQKQFNKHRTEKNIIDIIFQNEKGELTEGSFTNLFIKKDGVLYTPPLECGLLNGVGRQLLLDNTNFKIEEKILKQEDLESADQLYICNSLRGLIKVKYIR